MNKLLFITDFDRNGIFRKAMYDIGIKVLKRVSFL